MTEPQRYEKREGERYALARADECGGGSGNPRPRRRESRPRGLERGGGGG